MTFADWLKKNVVIVICVVLILAMLPTAWIFASGWSGRIIEEREREVNSQKSALGSARNYTYVLAPATPGGEPIEVDAAPNAQLIEFFAAERERRLSTLTESLREAVRINRRDHEPIIEGVLPSIEGDDEIRRRRLILEAGRRFAGTSPETSVYGQMLADLNAGGPADLGELGQRLAGLYDSQRDRFTSQNADGELTEAQQETIEREVQAARVAAAAQHAQNLSIFADMSVFDAVPAVLLSEPSTQANESDVFWWHASYWALNDLFDAVETANTVSGSRLPVEDAPIKRLLSIDMGGLVPVPSGESAGSKASHTGRVPSQPEQPYLLRHTTLSMIVDAEAVVNVIDAFSSVNYITVVGIEMTDVDPYAALNQGYYYGTQSVVRLELTLESAWLTAWLSEFMPAGVKRQLNVTDTPAEDAADA